MNSVVQKISLDIHKTGSQLAVSMIRGDTKRYLHITLTEGGKPYVITRGCLASFIALKSDDRCVSHLCEIDYENSTIIYNIKPQTVAVPGTVKCQIELIGNDGGILTSPEFSLIVGDTLYDQNKLLKSSDEFNTITAFKAELIKKENSGLVADARNVASSIVGHSSGCAVMIGNSANVAPRCLKIYGKSTQNGIPAPDAPVDIVSIASDGNIVVNVNEQNFEVRTPNGLRGIPVTDKNLATYTDENGQMWCADEIDLERGVYVQRIYEKVLNGTETIGKADTGAACYFQIADELVAKNASSDSLSGALCNHLSEKTPNKLWSSVGDGFSLSSVAGYTIRLRIESTTTVAALKEQLAIWNIEGNPLTIICRLSTPIEIPLSEREIEQYSFIKMNYPNTTILNDENAYMDVEYVVDTQLYINSIIGTPPPIISYINLPASKWQDEEEDDLYSQVVSISGVTENSKIDINPSVEQLAIFHKKDIAFVTENEDGVVTVYCIGQKPVNDYSMQVTITEVATNG